jgi:hypothetical protein
MCVMMNRMNAACLILGLLASLPACAADGAAPEIAPNTWVAAKVEHILPKDIPDARWQTGDGYCGSTWRSKTGELISRSGVRSKKVGLAPGFYSNTTLAWDLKTNKVRVVEIANWGGGSYGGGKLLPAFKEHPTPTPRHTYDGLTYVESQDAMYFILGANWRVGSRATDEAKAQKAIDDKSTWKYTFEDGKWHRIDDSIRRLPNGRRSSPYEAHLQHWPEGGKLLFFDSYARCYAEFDLKTEKWAELKTKNKCPMSLYNARSTWDSKRALWVFRLGPKAATFDPKTKSFTALPDAYPMPEDKKDKRRAWKGVTYISKHDVYLITGPTGNDTKVWDIATGKWLDVAGGEIKLVNGYPQYDPKADLVGLVYQLKTYKFRYVPKVEEK